MKISSKKYIQWLSALIVAASIAGPWSMAKAQQINPIPITTNLYIAKFVCGFQDGGFMIANMELLSQPERNSQSRENIKDISSSTLCSERRLVRLSLFVCS